VTKKVDIEQFLINRL